MKKVLFTAALFTASAFVMAQDGTTTTTTTTTAPSTTSSTPSEFKPGAGANNLELNFTPLGATPIKLTYIRYRRFLSETTALRLGVGLSFESSSVDVVMPSNVVPTATLISKSKTSKMGWNLRPGIEKHFAGTNRLSPYFGAELDLAGQSSKTETPSLSPTDAIIITTTRNGAKGGFFRIGAGVLAGFDCYITKHLYLGAEFGFGLQVVNYSKLKTEITPAAGPAIIDVDQGSEFNLGPNYNSALRLGWIF